ncbi:MAG: RHS repeat-associated core domain-containing protein [Bryobacteraceae bacterium]
MNTGFALATNSISQQLPSLPAATLLSLYLGPPHGHMHPPSFTPPATPAPVPLPSFGPILLGNCVKVLINGLPAARAGDLGWALTCCGFFPAFEVYTGSSKVFIGGMRAARMIDMCRCCQPGLAGAPRGIAAAMAAAGEAIAIAGVVADTVDAANASGAMSEALGLSATMGIAQAAADAVAIAVRAAMGKDIAVPPSVGAIVIGHPNVLIGGFPMINFPNPALKLFEKLGKMFSRSGPENEGCGRSGEPVDVVSGANVDEFLDYELSGPIPLRWGRCYDSSQNGCEGPLGYAHRHEYQRELRRDVDGFRYTDQQGRTIGFPDFPPDRTEVANKGFVLRRLDDRVYQVGEHRRPAMEFEFYDRDGSARLVRLRSGSHSIKFEHDERERLSGIVDSRHRTLRLIYDKDDHVVELRRPGESHGQEQVVTAYEYDNAGNLMKWTDALGNSARFEYDPFHRMTRKEDRRGYSYHYRYDGKGRCVHTFGDDGLYDVRLSYEPLVRCTTATFSDGGAWTYSYDENGTITQIIDPYGGVRQRKFDDTGRVREDIDAAGNVTRLLYTGTGAHVGRVDPLGYWFAPLSQEPHPRNPLAHRVPTTPLEWEYGTLLRASAIVGGLHDEDPVLADVSAQITRSMPGHSGKMASPGKEPERRYDVLGRLVEQYDGTGESEEWKYDPNGNVLQHRDRDGSVQRKEYFSWNLLRRQVDPLGNVSEFAYSPSEEITRFVDAADNTSEYTYDQKDRLIRVHRNGRIREEYRYDVSDNLIEKLDGNGRALLSFEIGAANLKSRRKLASGETHSFEYDYKGRFTKASTDKFTVTFAYDKAGRRTLDQRDGLGVTHQFIEGRLAVTTVFGRFTVKYEASDDALFIADPKGGVHSLRVSRSGSIHRTLSNGLHEISRYDAGGKCLFKTQWRNGRQWERWDRAYEYSAEGDLLRVADSEKGVTTYKYDAAHRLKLQILPDGTRSEFEHDAAGNLLRKPGLSGATLSEGNRLIHANLSNYTYNSRDHIETRESSAGKARYIYDSRDLLIGIDLGADEWRSDHDPLGRRVEKRIGANATRFYWDADRLAAEVYPNGVLRIYVYADAVALVPFMFLDYESIDAPPASGRRYFLSTNQIGVPIRVEDEEGKIVWKARIDPYGEAHPDPASSIEMPLRFPGHYHDSETGLSYNRFRYYSPELGRYLQSDPLGIAGGHNLYAYPSNPLTIVDILGLNHPDQEDKNQQKAGTPEDELAAEQTKPTPPGEEDVKALLEGMSEEDRNRILARTEATDRKGRPFGTPGNPEMPTVAEFDPQIKMVPAGELEGLIGDRTKHGLNPEQQQSVNQMSNDDLTSFRPEDPISATHNDDGTLNQTGGHHRAAEIGNRVKSGDMDPNTPVPVMIHE